MPPTTDLFELLLPTELLPYFDIIKVDTSESDQIKIFLDESNLSIEENPEHHYHSKGFYAETSIQDFPIRGKQVFLYIRRRHWTDTRTGDPYMRDLSYIAKGTRITQGFADFLKGLY